MLKLVKYDLRRNRDKIWGALVVLLLVQSGIWISAEVSDWDREAMFIMNIASYTIGGVVLLVQACITYDYNLKSYHRRLLPLKSVYTVLSPLLTYLFMLLGVIALAALHLGLYMLLDSRGIPEDFGSVAAAGLIQLLWSACFVMLILMLSITIARSLRFRAGVWIGIATFIVVQNGFAWLELALFGSSINSLDSAFQIKLTGKVPTSDGGMAVAFQDLFKIGPMLFEAGFAAVMLYVITVLVKRRVES
ncbi:hypothetical protein PaeBR_15325 [Paenibacillus sp. BR2-3]|uniref:hypothetical protein n=1 Tax=Paenibacillus sp. BR2-3 TaxID=3048494 RepID=UPI0039773BCB